MNISAVGSTGLGDIRLVALRLGASVNPVADAETGAGVDADELNEMPLAPAADADADKLAYGPL